MTREVLEIRHDLRNMKLVVDAQMDAIRDIEVRTNSLNAKIYTTISVAAVFIGFIGFVVNVFLSVQ